MIPLHKLLQSSSDDDVDDATDRAISIGPHIRNTWKQRRIKLVSDYAITIWMLSLGGGDNR